MPLYIGNTRVKLHLDSYSFNVAIPTCLAGQFVLDFGLPIELEIDEQYPIASVESTTTFGTAVLLENNTVTYTPTTILLDYDIIYAKTTSGQSVEIRAYPANNIFYDASFLTVDNSATKEGQDTWALLGEPDFGSQQNCSVEDVYGFDPHYENEAVANRRWYTLSAVHNNSKSRLTCTFVGDGISIICAANCNSAVDYVRITNAVTSSAGVVKSREWYASSYFPNTDDFNSTGLELSDTNLYFGEHVLSIYPNYAQAYSGQTNMTSQVFGICVYNTLKYEPACYVEHNAKFHTKSPMISNSSWDDETGTGVGFICCDNSDSGLTFAAPTDTEFTALPSTLVCKILDDIEVQFYLNTQIDGFCPPVSGLKDRSEIVSSLPMYYKCECIETTFGKFIAISTASADTGLAILGMKTLGSEFEYLPITKDEIGEVVDILYGELTSQRLS